MTRSFRSQAVGGALVLMALVHSGCSGKSPLSPTEEVLPERLDSASFSYRYSPGDQVQPERQEAHHAWAVARLGIMLPQKIEYNKYTSRSHMGQATGRDNTNGFAEPGRFAVHTLWAWDNHEPVHVYSALVGRPSDFFNEGIAVAFQTDPAAGDFESRFNGLQVHDAAGAYRRQGQLPPLEQIVDTQGFRNIPDSVLAYRVAGSFVRFLIDRDGIEAVKAFFRTGNVGDSRQIIGERFREAFGRSLAEAESGWHALLDGR
jgi:hypothetical protein